MRSILRKTATLIKVIRLFRNWHLVILTYFGFYHIKAKILSLRNGVEFALASDNDWPVLLEIWLSKTYIRSGIEIKENDVIIDIGAHIGTFSIFAATYSDGVIVYSYEPHPVNYSLLVKNIDLNHLRNIEPFKLAVAATEGRKNLFLSPNSDGHSLSNQQGKGQIEVECITLEQTLEKAGGRCNLLKMDCEGAEYEILLNASAECLRKIDQISMEYHDMPEHLSKASKYNINSLKAYLEQIGFRVTWGEAIDTHLTYLYATMLSQRN